MRTISSSVANASSEDEEDGGGGGSVLEGSAVERGEVSRVEVGCGDDRERRFELQPGNQTQGLLILQYSANSMFLVRKLPCTNVS